MIELLKKGEAGQVLVIALVMVALGGLLLSPLLQQVCTNTRYHQLIQCKTLNICSADAGIEYARAELFNNMSAYLETPLQAGFTLNNRTVNVTATYQGGGIYTVDSTAGGGGCRPTVITTLVKLDYGAFAYAAAGKDIVKVEYSLIDSAPTTGKADIRSNKVITVVGPGALVNGDAYAADIITGQEYISGDCEEGFAQLTFPDPYTELYEELAKEGGIYEGNLEYKDGGIHENVGPIYVTGNFKVIEGTQVTLGGPVYAEGNLEVKSGGKLLGDHYLFAVGNIVIESGGYESGEIPVIISPDHNISVKGPTTVVGVLYAPNGNVVIENLAVVYGAAAGKSVTIKNMSAVVYEESLHGRTDLPGSEMSVISYNVE